MRIIILFVLGFFFCISCGNHSDGSKMIDRKIWRIQFSMFFKRTDISNKDANLYIHKDSLFTNEVNSLIENVSDDSSSKYITDLAYLEFPCGNRSKLLLEKYVHIWDYERIPKVSFHWDKGSAFYKRNLRTYWLETNQTKGYLAHLRRFSSSTTESTLETKQATCSYEIFYGRQKRKVYFSLDVKKAPYPKTWQDEAARLTKEEEPLMLDYLDTVQVDILYFFNLVDSLNNYGWSEESVVTRMEEKYTNHNLAVRGIKNTPYCAYGNLGSYERFFDKKWRANVSEKSFVVIISDTIKSNGTILPIDYKLYMHQIAPR